MLYAAKIDVEDGSSSFKLFIDGLEVAESAVPQWLAVEANPDEITVDPPLGYKWVNSGSIWRNTDSHNHRIEIKAEHDDYLMFGFDNPSVMQFNNQHIGVCLASVESTETPNKTYTLTLDDKGIYPSDNIYSGTISPPNPSLYLTFRIQWFSDMNMNEGTSNSRVLYVDSDYMQFSLDGSTWSVNLNSLQSSLLPNHMDQSGFYELAIFPIAGLNDPSFEIISDEIYYPYSSR